MKQIKIPIRRPWIPYIILVIALLLTCLSTLYVRLTVEEHERLRFANIVQQTQNSINNRLETYVALVRGGAALFAVQPDISREEFQTYVTRLNLQERYPGIQGFGYAPRITEENKEDFIENLQDEYGNDVTLSPEGERSVYYPILYLRPENEPNQNALGYDMFSEPIRREAMERARDTGQTATSGKVTLVQEIYEEKQPGFLIYTPLYEGGLIPTTVEERRERIVGYIYSPFRINDFLRGIFGTPDIPLVNYKVYDETTISEENLLYDSTSTSEVQDENHIPSFQATRQISLAGQTWTLVFTTRPNFDDSLQKVLPPAIFIGGFLISLTLFLLSRAEYLARTNAEEAAFDLQQSQRQLQKAVGLRDNFISIASHELKTPVTSLKVYAEVLLRQFSKTKDTQTTDYLSKMNKQIDKLTVLIQDLLDVSRLQSGRLAFREETFHVDTMINEVVENTQQISDKHKIIVKSKSKKKLTGDKDRIGQVLSNLLTNAIKYSPKADKIIVSTKETTKNITVSVQDFGIGIDKKHQDKIFSRFYRVTDTDERTYPGLGIGLFICNEIIRRHGGEIKIKSNKGKGSTFSFTLPYKKQ